MDYDHIQRMMKDLERSGVFDTAEALRKAGVFDTQETLRQAGVYDTDERLRQAGVFDTAEALSQAGVFDAAKRISEIQSGFDYSQMQKIADSATQARMEPFLQEQAAQQELITRLHENMMPSIDPQAYLAASNIAAQTINGFDESVLRSLETIYTERFDELIKQATMWASNPQIQDLLRGANEMIASLEANVAESTEPFSADMPDMPQFYWVFELDRETLRFLVKLLFHLTAILTPALGLAAAHSDPEINIVDLAALVVALNTMLHYALLALNTTDD
jgi:hypothetical protein